MVKHESDETKCVVTRCCSVSSLFAHANGYNFESNKNLQHTACCSSFLWGILIEIWKVIFNVASEARERRSKKVPGRTQRV